MMFFFAITIWDQQNYIESFETLNKRKSVPGAEKEIFQTMLLNHHNLVTYPRNFSDKLPQNSFLFEAGLKHLRTNNPFFGGYFPGIYFQDP